MAQDDDPLISVITVNFNGKSFLKDLFDSILNLNYPLKKLQIIMVDNHSTDGSIEFVEDRFPRVEIIRSKENRGYAGGNNAGFAASKGKFIALVNNDCVVDKNWLREMLLIFKQSTDNAKIGAVGPKIVFYHPYLPLQIISNNSSQKGARDPRRLGVKISGIKIIDDNGSKKSNKAGEENIKYLDGFYPPESDENGNTCYWSQGNAILAVPVSDPGKDIEIQFNVSSYLSPNKLQFVIGGEILDDLKVYAKQKKIRLKIPKELFTFRKDIINSCAIKVNKSFFSRDRGYLSFDEGQYGRVEEVFGLSGCSFLMDRKMLEDVGNFDEYFFTYYEDIDLFWRSRLRGWKNFYTPNSVVRHHHCGTGKEWSYSFTYHVLRNRLLMVYKNGWPLLFLRSYAAFVISKIIHTLYYAASRLKGARYRRIDVPIRFKIFFELAYMLPKYFPERIRIRNGRKARDKDIKNWVRDF